MSKRLYKDDIVKEIKRFKQDNGLNHTEIVLGYGAALVMHGLREHTADLDIDVPLIVMGFLNKKYKAVTRMAIVGICSNVTDIISIHPGLWGSQEVVTIEGVVCYTLPVLKKHKEFLRDHPDRISIKRPQDDLDIAAIEAAIASAAA